MKLTPASVSLAVMLALSASSVVGRKPGTPADPRAAQWMASGSTALASGDLAGARDAYETALLLSPSDADIYYALGKVARAQKLPGKAIRYFNKVLELEPNNQEALQAEGLAMMDKGATESARQTLAKLKTLCKTNCASADTLAAAIAAGPPKLAAADASTGKALERP